MSLIPCRRAQIRSMPRPKANPLYVFRVVANLPEHVGVDHPRPAHLDPAALGAHVDLDARLSEREKRGTETDVNVGAKALRANSRKTLFRSAMVTFRSTSNPSI